MPKSSLKYSQKKVFIINNKGATEVLKNEDLNRIAYHLKCDKNKNVNSHMIDIKNITEIPFNEDSPKVTNCLFTNKMLILKEEFGIVRNLPVNSVINAKFQSDSTNIINVPSEDNQSKVETIAVECNEIETDNKNENNIADNIVPKDTIKYNEEEDKTQNEIDKNENSNELILEKKTEESVEEIENKEEN